MKSVSLWHAVTDTSAQFSFKCILVFIFKPGFLGVAPLHNLVINLLLEGGYVCSNTSASKAPTSANGFMCGVESSFEVQSIFTFAPGLLSLSIGPFQIS